MPTLHEHLQTTEATQEELDRCAALVTSLTRMYASIDLTDLRNCLNECFTPEDAACVVEMCKDEGCSVDNQSGHLTYPQE